MSVYLVQNAVLEIWYFERLSVLLNFILRRKRRSSQCFFKPSRVSHGLIARHTRSVNLVVCFIKMVYLALYRLHFLQTSILFHCNGCLRYNIICTFNITNKTNVESIIHLLIIVCTT